MLWAETTKYLAFLTLFKAHVICNHILLANKAKGKGTMHILNKRDSEMKEPWTNTQVICKKKYYHNFHNKCNLLHHQEISNQFDFESELTTKAVTKKIFQSWMLSLHAQGTLVMYKDFLLLTSVLHYFIYKICLVYQYNIVIIIVSVTKCSNMIHC